MPDLAKLMPAIARHFWGEPNRQLSNAKELRWGRNGSKSVNINKGTWFDHEAGEGGGVRELLKGNGIGKWREWLVHYGFAEPENQESPAKSNGGERTRHRIAVTYDYCDEHGMPLFQVVRFEPKTFRQRRSNGAGWTWSLEGVEPVLFHLPEVLEALALEHPIYIVEGEKDVMTMEAFGLVATTNPMGVGKWRDSYSEVLAGAECILLPDNDEAGREHMLKVKASLIKHNAFARTVYLPGLPEKGDVTDWFRAGHTVEELNALVEADEAGKTSSAPSALEIWDAGEVDDLTTPREWLLGKTFCRGFISSLIAGGAVGKTTIRYLQYGSLATARNLSGEHVFCRARVLILSFEDGADELKRRLRALRLHYNIARSEFAGWLYVASIASTAPRLMVYDQYRRPQLGGLAEMIEAEVLRLKIDLVTLDPFIKTHKLEENKNSEIDEVATLLADLARRLNIAVDIPDHLAKAVRDGTAAVGGRGASAKVDAQRLVYQLTTMTKEDAEALGVSPADQRFLVRIDSTKVNIAPPSEEAMWFRLVGVPLGNATERYPNGDTVATAEPWKPKGLFDDIPVPVINAILDDIDAGIDDLRYSDANAATTRAAWRVVVKHIPEMAPSRARKVIAEWLRTGLLVNGPFDNPNAKGKGAWGLFVDNSKRPGRV